jgi:hypothetical protein
MNQETRDLEAKIDAAIASYPIAPLPSGFTAQVMARATPRMATRPLPYIPWRFYPLDLTLTIFFTIFFLSILYTVWWAVGPRALAWLSNLLTSWQIPADETLSPSTWLAVILAATACCEVAVAALWFLFLWDRTFHRSSHAVHLPE